MAPTLTTARLCLRHWRDDDLPALAAMSADARVMAWFPATLSREESDALATRLRDELARQPFGIWAVEIPGVAPFAGFVGLTVPRITQPDLPGVEIAWRLAAEYWHQGYATEAAQAVLAHGFETVGLPAIGAYTTEGNTASRAVMQRLGLHYLPEADFDHPLLPEGHRLRRHVLYRLDAAQWAATQG